MTTSLLKNHLYFVMLFLILCCFHQGSSMGLQHFVERPRSVSAVEGEDVLLRCIVAGQQGRVQWTKDGFALGFERHVPGYPRYTYLGDAGLGQHHLSISQVSLRDDGEYQCQVGPTFNSPPIWAAANVTVLLAPTRVSLDGHRDGSVMEVSAGVLFSLRCSGMEAHPPPTILWYLAGTQVDQDKVQTQVKESSMDGRWDVISEVALRPGPEEDGKRVTCRAIHPGVSARVSLTSSVTLSIKHEPGVPEVRGYQSDDFLRVGERRSLICRVKGGNPSPALLWYRDGRLVDDTYGREQTGSRVTVNALEIIGRENENGVTYECRTTSPLLRQPLLKTITLSVHYGPDNVEVTGPGRVEEGAIISLRCHTTKANPPATLTWHIDGKVMTSPGSVVSRVNPGGWVSSSQLVWSADVRDVQRGEVIAECRAAHPILPHYLRTTHPITILKEAGTPVLEGEVIGDVISGSSVDIQCVSSGIHPDATIRIYKNGQAMAMTMENEGNITRAHSQVRVMPSDNGAEVKCEVTSQGSRKSKVTTTRLSVLFGPRDISVSVLPNPAEEGSLVDLKCRTSSSHPAANLTWTSLGAPLPISSTHVAPAAFGGSSTRSDLQVKVTPEDNGRRFQCDAQNGLGSPLQKEVILKVLHAPVWQRIPELQVNVWEGSDVAITATATANPGPVRYWWRRGRETLVAAGGLLRLGPAERKMAGNYTISAYTGRGAINTTFFLNIKYGPDNFSAPERIVMSEGERVIIKCSATGKPIPSLVWMHRNRTLGSGVGTAKVVISEVKGDDSGVYVCLAASSSSDPPPSVTTKLIVKQGVRVSREMDEGQVSWVSVGGNGRLSCYVKAHPRPVFKWTSQDGNIIESNHKYIIHEPVCEDGVTSWVSVMEIIDVTPADYRAYYCSATNTLGSDSIKLMLRPPSRPLPPNDLRVVNVTNVTVTLGWVPNSAGGQPKGYTIKYKPTGTLQYQYEDVKNGNKTQVTVKGLQPGKEYSITTQATNSHGSSDYVTPALTFTSLGSNGKIDGGTGDLNTGGGGSQTSSLLFLIIVLAAIVLLALNITVATCLLRHFRKKKRSSIKSCGSTKTTSVTTGTHINTSSSTPEIQRHHHHHHHQARVPLTRTMPITARKIVHHRIKSHADGNLASSSTAGQKNTRQKKQAKTKIRAISALLHTDKTTQQDMKNRKANKKSLNTKEYIARNGNAAQSRIPNAPLLNSAEIKSLIQHDQETTIPVSAKIQNNELDDDQVSDSSHESTETAIFLETIPPPPPDGYGIQNNIQGADHQHIMMDSEHSHLLQEQNTEMIDRMETQHKSVPSSSMQLSKEIEQSAIMTELQNAISERIQNHIQKRLSQGDEPLSPQATSQQPFQDDYPRPAERPISQYNMNIPSLLSPAMYSIPATGRPHQHRESNSPNTLTPRQHKQFAESHDVLHYNPSSTSSKQKHLDKSTPSLPLKVRGYHRFLDSSSQEMQSESAAQHRQMLPPTPKAQSHLISQGLPTKPQSSKYSARKQLNISPKSADKNRHSSAEFKSYNSASHSNADQHNYSPKSSQYDFQSNLQYLISPMIDRGSQTTLFPATTSKNQQKFSDSSNSTEYNSSHQHHKASSSPIPHIILHTPSPSGQSPSIPTPPIQYIPPPPTPPPIQTQQPSTSHQNPQSSPNISQLPPIPLKSVHHRPPPTPPRLRNKRSSPSSAMLGLPPKSQSVPGQQNSSSEQIQSTNTRQQARSMVFRKSISKSLEDYYSKNANKSEKQDYNNSAATQTNSMSGSSGISVSLPKNMNIREGNTIQHIVQPSIQRIIQDDSPAATSSPIANRRQHSRFPHDFLWQGSSRK